MLHHEKFQQIESAWRGLQLLVDRTNFLANTQIELLNVSKAELADDFNEVGDPLKGGLFQQTYTSAYDQYGANPFSYMIANYEFDSSPGDIDLLRKVADVAAATHCPFFAATGPKFFRKGSFNEVTDVMQLDNIMGAAAFLNWKSFREEEHSRYIGLTLPKFLLRLPYGEKTVKIKNFNYAEDVKREDNGKYLWGNAAFAMAANINRSFAEHGWPVNIIGPLSGGMVENLPLHVYEVGGLEQFKKPLEITISDMLERDFAEHGFIPLLVHEGKKVQACFFSANSAQIPQKYSTEAATASARLGTRLPYMLLVSRLSHYLRVIERDDTGRMMNAAVVQAKLQDWINKYVSGPDARDERLKAERPLQAAKVEVKESLDKPGCFNVSMNVIPHYQIEEVNIELSLVAEMPKGKG